LKQKKPDLLSGPTGRPFLQKMFDKKKSFLKQKMQTCCLALRAGSYFLSMVRSGGSNNCSIQRIEPWLRIAQQLLRYAQPWLTKKANLFLFAFFVSKSFFFSPFLVSLPVGPDNRLGFPKENLPGIPSLPFSAFFCPFFFFKKKSDEKG